MARIIKPVMWGDGRDWDRDRRRWDRDRWGSRRWGSWRWRSRCWCWCK
jgi:hypothetical protein